MKFSRNASERALQKPRFKMPPSFATDEAILAGAELLAVTILSLPIVMLATLAGLLTGAIIGGIISSSAVSAGAIIGAALPVTIGAMAIGTTFCRYYARPCYGLIKASATYCYDLIDWHIRKKWKAKKNECPLPEEHHASIRWTVQRHSDGSASPLQKSHDSVISKITSFSKLAKLKQHFGKANTRPQTPSRNTLKNNGSDAQKKGPKAP